MINLSDAGPQKEEGPAEPTPGEDVYAIFADRFYVISNAGHTRIAFGEAPTGAREFYRMAVVLPTVEAKRLAELILRLIRELDEEEDVRQP